MTAQDLKNSILQQAIQGKLLPQNSADEPASELLKKISAERQKLIDEGKIKNPPQLPPISDDEKPFDIPENWQWVRLGEIVYSRQQKKPDKKFSYIDIGSINNACQKLNEQEKILSPENAPSRARKPVKFGDVIYATVRPYLHNVALIDKKFGCEAIASTGFAAMVCLDGLLNKYLLYYLISPTFDIYANAVGNSKGMAYPAINDKTFYNAVIALPPLAEQKRIVEKLEEILPLVERYGELEQRLTKLDKEFPDKLKKSLLQQAIQGKLTEQLTTDGDAKDLLEKIRAEKSKLIAEGKIKKEKTLPPIKAEEIPFDIPENWQWVRLGEIVPIKSSKRVFEKDYVSDGIPFFRSKEIGDLSRNEEIKTRLYISPEHYQNLKNNFGVPQQNDILITSVGSIGNVWICDGREFYYKDGNIVQICSTQNSFSKYIAMLIRSPFFELQVNNSVAGTAYSALTIIKLKHMVFPLPPLAEQKRIVERLEELLPLCDRLK